MTRRVHFAAVSTLLIAVLAACSSPPDAIPTDPEGPVGPPSTEPPAVVTPPTSTPVEPTPPVAPPTIPVPGPTTATADPSGDRLPDTAYAIPAGAIFIAPTGDDAAAGTEAAPVRSIRRAITMAPEGGTIVMRGGEHRTWYSAPGEASYDVVGKRLTIQAYPHEAPWFNGADVVTGWQPNGAGRWSRRWETPSFCDGKYYQHAPTAQPTSNTGPCAHQDNVQDPAFPVAGDPQQLFVDGVNQRQVLNLAQVGPGSFHYDWATRTLTTGTDPNARTLEASVRPVALILGGGRDYTIRGVGFRRYASNEYSNLTGATLYLGGGRPVVENVVVSHNAGVGIALSDPRPGATIRDTVFAHNGSIGLGANGSSRTGERNDLLVESSIFNGNNREHFGGGCSAACGAGNIKLARMVGYTVRDSVIENARGVEGMGLWCDINCSDAVMVNNLVRNNGKHGIFYEISSKGLIASNLVVGNGEKGLMIGSATTKIYNNTVIVDTTKSPKAQGIAIFDDPRWPNSPPETGPNTTGIELVNNVMSGPAGALLLVHNGPGPNNTKVEQFFTALHDNAYHHGGQNIINWADNNPAAGGKFYSSVTAFRSAVGLDQRSVESIGGADPFTRRASGDYRLLSSSPIAPSGSALPSDVARSIGVTAGAAVSRGALTWPAAAW